MQTVTILKSLADDTRLSVVRELAKTEWAVPSSEIVTGCATALQLSQPTMSHHFKQLVQSGVLNERKVGTEKLYRLNRELLLAHGIDPSKL